MNIGKHKQHAEKKTDFGRNYLLQKSEKDRSNVMNEVDKF